MTREYMLMPELGSAHWIGLLDAGGVLAAFLLWVVLAGRRARAVAGVCGGALLLLVAGRAIDRMFTVWFVVGARSSLSLGGAQHVHWTEIGFTVGALLAGAFVATSVAHPVEAIAGEIVEPVELPPLPAAAWSRPEVIGDAPEGPPDDDEPVVPTPPPPHRGVVVPLLTVAVALGLPVAGFGVSVLAAGTSRPGPYSVAAHLLAGLLVGIALLGAVVALDVRQRGFAAVAFVLVAAGVGLSVAWPRTFLNPTWTAIGSGLAAGLLAPAVLAALRSVSGLNRRAMLAGVVAALAVVAAVGVTSGRGYLEQRRVEFDSNVS